MELIKFGQAGAPMENASGIQVPFRALLKADGTVAVETFEHLMANPVRRRAQVSVEDAESFVRYIKRYQTLGNRSQQVVFAQIEETGASFAAILDYHDADVAEFPPSPADTSIGGSQGAEVPGCRLPNWGKHRIMFTCKQTPEWKRWTEKSGVKMSQVDFAEFLEDNGVDINPNNTAGMPSMADMVEIARNMSATVAGDFNQAIRLGNGNVQFKWTETIEAKAQTNSGEIQIPERFVIGIAPFTGFDGFEIHARLKYRLQAGKLTMWFELERPHKVVERAAQQVLAKITTETGLTPFRGNVLSMGL